MTLALQNASLAIIMHYSRIASPPSRTYSAATAVLLNELLKGSISLCIAFYRIGATQSRDAPTRTSIPYPSFMTRCTVLARELFSSDCWKLSIPAILYGRRVFRSCEFRDSFATF